MYGMHIHMELASASGRQLQAQPRLSLKALRASVSPDGIDWLTAN